MKSIQRQERRRLLLEALHCNALRKQALRLNMPLEAAARNHQKHLFIKDSRKFKN